MKHLKNPLHLFFYTVLGVGSFFLISLFLYSTKTYAEAFENNDFSLSENGGVFIDPLSVTLIPKEGKKISWTFFRENPASVHSTTELTRIFILKNRNLYVFSETEQIKKFKFKINKNIKNTFFRFVEVDSNPSPNFLPTLTLQNKSPYNFSLKGWSINSSSYSLSLPNEEMEAGEKRRFIFPFNTPEEIQLLSPDKRVRERLFVPIMKPFEYFLLSEKTSPANTENNKFVIQEKILQKNK